MLKNDTICAIATAHGIGAIAVIRLSGPDSIDVCDKVFQSAQKGKKLCDQKANTIHFGTINSDGQIIDEVLVSVFKAPHSYTGENGVEISCHGSMYIQQKILHILLLAGARMAEPGEFTLRAFINGKIDLSQAEAVADLIASSSEASRRVSLHQMRGGFSNEIKKLRKELLHFISLIELELDFSEEDVEFADREKLKALIQGIISYIDHLVSSFSLGNVIKTGIPVAIAGEPNVGKSSLLNRLLNEEKAIVSDIPGTTRDSIEDVITINGQLFRFIDTAGLRHTTDTIESIGIERAYQKIRGASIVLFLEDAAADVQLINQRIDHVRQEFEEHTKLILVLNKIDQLKEHPDTTSIVGADQIVGISAKFGLHIDRLQAALQNAVNIGSFAPNDTILTNSRHYDALNRANQALLRAMDGLDTGISGDFLSQDIRESLLYLGEITGEITTDEVLGNIFKHFCIGK